MSSSGPEKTFQIKAGTDKTVDINITELPGVKAENLGLKTWGAAWILSNNVHHLAKHVAGLGTSAPVNILEIGAGTGLSGLAAAAIWQCNAVITDLPTIVPGMAANIDLNTDLLSARQSRVQCGTLDWFDPKYLHVRGVSKPLKSVDSKFQIILAADTLYSEDHPQLMADTIFEWLARDEKACFIVCYAQRIAYLDHIRELWSLLEAGGLHSIEEGIEVGDASWDEEAPFEWAVFKWKQYLPCE